MDIATKKTIILSAIFIFLIFIFCIFLTHEDVSKTTFKVIEKEVVITSKFIDEVCYQAKNYLDSCYSQKNKNICDYEIFVKLNELHGISKSQFLEIMEICHLNND